MKRLATSLHVVAREHGFAALGATRWCSRPCACYREYVDEYAAHAHARRLVRPDDGRRPRRRTSRSATAPKRSATSRRALRKDHVRAVARLTDRSRRAAAVPSRTRRSSCTSTSSNRGWTTSRPTVANYRESLTDERRFLFDRFRVVDVARRVVGVGSVGTRCWVTLARGGRAGRRRARPDRAPGQGGATVGAGARRGSRRPAVTRGGGWWRASASPRPPATSSWGGARRRAAITTTCASSGT